ncbi:MAG: hypothetical protein E7H83_01890 [Enterobacteriaceae bacterium]|nr:hypothetical protein [Enterobacteriaceae bacterium]
MKLIKYWHVKLYRNLSTIVLSKPMETLIFEGYSKDKPVLKPHDEGLIELFTAPDQLETKTIRTCGFSSMVCTPVYEEEKGKVHDHACLNCFTGSGPCTGECNVQDENKRLSTGVMQEYFPNGGRDWDQISSLYDAICDGKIPGLQATQLNPPRCEMLEYIKAAIGEGYQPENEEAITDLSLIDALNDNDLNREFGKCWQWYDMGGGIHETFEVPKRVAFENVTKPVIQWLNENTNPHAIIVIDPTGATLHTGEIGYQTEEFLKD